MGADYIPEDNLLGRVNPETTRKLLEKAKFANYNAIRVWGGGYYPSDWFYDIDVYKRQEEHLLHSGPHCANEINMWNDDTFPQWPKHPGKLTTLEEAKHLLDLYDDGVKYTDDNIGQIIGWLKDNGLYDLSLIHI